MISLKESNQYWQWANKALSWNTADMHVHACMGLGDSKEFLPIKNTDKGLLCSKTMSYFVCPGSDQANSVIINCTELICHWSSPVSPEW
jgi:hypothetical protein